MILILQTFFMIFFLKLNHLFFDWSRANCVFPKGLSDIRSLSNVQYSRLLTDFVTFISFGLVWMYFTVFETFCILQMVIWFSMIWFRFWGFLPLLTKLLQLTRLFFFFSWMFDIKCSFYHFLRELLFSKHRFCLKGTTLLQWILRTGRNKTNLTI